MSYSPPAGELSGFRTYVKNPDGTQLGDTGKGEYKEVALPSPPWKREKNLPGPVQFQTPGESGTSEKNIHKDKARTKGIPGEESPPPKDKARIAPKRRHSEAAEEAVEAAMTGKPYPSGSDRQHEQKGPSKRYHKKRYLSQKSKKKTEQKRWYQKNKNKGKYDRDQQRRRDHPEKFKRKPGGGYSEPKDRSKDYREENKGKDKKKTAQIVAERWAERWAEMLYEKRPPEMDPSQSVGRAGVPLWQKMKKHPAEKMDDYEVNYPNPGSAKVIPEGHDFVNKMAVEDVRDSLTFRDTGDAGPGGQWDGVIVAYWKDTGQKAGYLDWASYGNEYFIKMIKTTPESRGRGVAVEILRYWIEDYKIKKHQLEWGMKTPDGVALQRRVERLVHYSSTQKISTRIQEILDSTSPQVKSKARGFPIKLRRVDSRNLIWLFDVTGSKGDPYRIRVKAFPKGRARNIDKVDVKVSCSCPFWKWQGPEHWAKSKGYLYGRPRGTASRPDIKDPKGAHGACKHMVAVLEALEGFIIPERSVKKWRGRKASVSLLAKLLSYPGRLTVSHSGEKITENVFLRYCESQEDFNNADV